MTSNPDETWGHKQHWGLGKIVQDYWREGKLSSKGKSPMLFGIREYGWYTKSQQPQTGDEMFRRDIYSPVLGMTYKSYWEAATSSYVTQPPHPVWLSGMIAAGKVPGYHDVDIIRRLDSMDNKDTLTNLFSEYEPSLQQMNSLPSAPIIIDLTGKN